MSDLIGSIRRLVQTDNIRVSKHAFRRLQRQKIDTRDLLETIHDAIVIEDYPDYFAGPSVLVLHYSRSNQPIHAVWGIAQNTDGPAVLVTAYRPDPLLWSKDFRRRK